MADRVDTPQTRDVAPESSDRRTPPAAPLDAMQLLSDARTLRPTLPATSSTFDAKFGTGSVTSDGSLNIAPIGGDKPKFDAKAPADSQLNQFAGLYAAGKPDKHGEVHAQVEVNGRMQDVAISRHKVGTATLLHVRDANDNLMMRAQERNGQWQHQRTAGGAEVSYYGKKYGEGAPEQSTAPAAEIKPRVEPKPGALPADGTIKPGKDSGKDVKPDGTDNGKDIKPNGTASGDPNVIGTWNGVQLTAYFSGRRAGRGEGGPVDQVGRPLYSVEEFLKDPSKPVSVAVDRDHMPKYGQHLHIPDLDRRYATQLQQLVDEGKLKDPHIRFTAVDNGPAVKGKHHIDVCLAKYKSSEYPNIDLAGSATVKLLDRSMGGRV